MDKSLFLKRCGSQEKGAPRQEQGSIFGYPPYWSNVRYTGHLRLDRHEKGAPREKVAPRYHDLAAPHHDTLIA